MKYRVIVQPRAAAQLDAEYLRIAEHAPNAAAAWFNRFVEALARLSQFPEQCSVARESEIVGTEVRQLLFGRRAGVRRALFLIDGNTIRVLAIRHAAQQDPSAEELLGS